MCLLTLVLGLMHSGIFNYAVLPPCSWPTDLHLIDVVTYNYFQFRFQEKKLNLNRDSDLGSGSGSNFSLEI